MAAIITSGSNTSALADLIEDNLIEKTLSFANTPGGEIFISPQARWFVTGCQEAKYNGVALAQFDLNGIASGIDSLLAEFKARKTPMMWWVGSRTQPPNLGRYLQQRQFIHNRDMIGMAAELSELQLELDPTIGLRFELVENKTQLAEWMPPFIESFNVQAAASGVDFDFFAAISFLPETLWRHYLARLNGKVVSVASLFLGVGVAGLYNVATPVYARGQGYGTWITKAVLRDAAQLGCQVATLQSTNPAALRLYHRLGFEIYNKTSIYQRQAVDLE